MRQPESWWHGCSHWEVDSSQKVPKMVDRPSCHSARCRCSWNRSPKWRHSSARPVGWNRERKYVRKMCFNIIRDRDIKRKSIKGRHDPVISWTNSQWNFFSCSFFLLLKSHFAFRHPKEREKVEKMEEKSPQDSIWLSFLCVSVSTQNLFLPPYYTPFPRSLALGSVEFHFRQLFLFISSLNSFHVYGKDGFDDEKSDEGTSSKNLYICSS